MLSQGIQDATSTSLTKTRQVK